MLLAADMLVAVFMTYLKPIFFVKAGIEVFGVSTVEGV
jgi:hypothetical protein